MIVYGIPGCDTIKKARRWLADNDVDFQFHDYKKSGIDSARLTEWASEVSWESLLNRRGTTWRKLDESDRDGINEARAIELMAEHTSLIKRPVVEHEGALLVGFDAAKWAEQLT